MAKYLIGLIFIITISSTTHACDLQAIEACGTSIAGVADLKNMASGTLPSTDRLKTMCSSLDTYMSCYEPLAAVCKKDPILASTLGSVEMSLDFICGQGYQGLLRHNTCLTAPEVMNGSLECNRQQNQTTMQLQTLTGNMSTAEIQDSYCQLLVNSSTCISDVVRENCGEMPGCLMETMMSRALSGTMSVMNCASNEPCSLTAFTTTATSRINTSNQTINTTSQLSNTTQALTTRGSNITDTGPTDCAAIGDCRPSLYFAMIIFHVYAALALR